MRRMLVALDCHWFAPASLRGLALVRILAFGSQTLVFLWFPDGRVRSVAEQLLQATAGAPQYVPLPALRLLLLPFGRLAHGPPSTAFLTATFAVAVVAGAMATVGLFARAAMLAAAAANLLIVAHHYSYGEYHHAEALMLIALGVLALGPSAAVWSVDAAWRRRRTGEVPPAESAFARWPLRSIQWTIALTYLSAAGAKLANGGLAWFNGYTMTYHYLTVALSTNRQAAAAMAALPPAWHIAPAAAGWLLEALFFVAILVPRAAWIFLLAGLGLHLGVYATMELAFFQTMVLYCVFAESLRLYGPRWLRPRGRPSHAGVRVAPATA